MQYQKTHHFFSNQVQIAAFWVPKISCLSRHVPNFVTSLQAATQSSVPTLLGSTSLMKFRGSVSPGPPGENIWQNPPLSNVLYPHCSKSFLHFFKNSKIIIFIFNNLDLETQKGHCLFWGETNWTNFNIQALNKKKQRRFWAGKESWWHWRALVYEARWPFCLSKVVHPWPQPNGAVGHGCGHDRLLRSWRRQGA